MMRELLVKFKGYKHNSVNSLIRRSRTPTSQFLICVVIWVFAYLLFFPEYDRIFIKDLYQDFESQIAHPLTPNDKYESTHVAKTELRLFIPFVAHVIGIDGIGLAFLAQFLALPFYLLVYKLFRRIGRDRVVAIFLTAAFACCFFGKAFNFHFYKDSYAHLFLVAAALFPGTIWQLIILICVGFIDERAIVAIGIYPFLNLLMTTEKDVKDLSFKSLLFNSIVPVVAFILILLLRFYFARTFHLTTPVGDDYGAGLGLIRDSFKWIPLTLLNAFDGFWLLIIIGFAYLWFRKAHLFSAYIASYMMGIITIAFCVYDITKSLGYLILIPFVFTFFLRDLTISQKRSVCLAVLALSLFIPNYYIWGGYDGHISWLSPILPKVFKLF